MRAHGLSTRPTGSVEVGDVLLGKYRIERVLGSGGMGVVLEATHLELADRVAIKLLHPQFLMDGAIVSRFLREARSAVKIRSEHVCRVLDVGRLEDGEPYLVMEYLDGTDLKGVMQDDVGLPVHEAVDYIVQACVAIAHAHRAGIVHRDLKPANMFLAKETDGTSVLKVLDFGISKLTGPAVDLVTTNTNTILGTPYYMAPEQLRAARLAEARSDVYSLGVVLYELLTGTLPFEGESLAELSVAVLTHEPDLANVRRPDLPIELASIVARALAKDPNERIASAAELAALLVPFGPPSSALQAERIARLSGYESPSSPMSAAPRLSSPSDPGRSSSPSVPMSAPTNSGVVPARKPERVSLSSSAPPLPSALAKNTLAESRAFEATAVLASSNVDRGEAVSPVPISVREPKRAAKPTYLFVGAALLVGGAAAFAIWRTSLPTAVADPVPPPSAVVIVSPPPSVAIALDPVPSAQPSASVTVATRPTATASTKSDVRPQPVRSSKPPPTLAAPPSALPQPAPPASVPRITTDRHG